MLQIFLPRFCNSELELLNYLYQGTSPGNMKFPYLASGAEVLRKPTGAFGALPGNSAAKRKFDAEKIAETKRRPLLNYTEKVQKDVTVNMRAILVDWQKLQLLGVSSMLIVAKYEEIRKYE
ncbi:hypothetical protein POM88_030866 [Heracleum sosnowskyi]|uniref:Uncharacterized protein n=1 Tax=Heracleum sosnowskyi TaxID=360622 RepID=A0AAD8MJR9_9APIA|nr:hypothetical protein POM88_030866 [Heracleum sosnowskyi]